LVGKAKKFVIGLLGTKSNSKERVFPGLSFHWLGVRRESNACLKASSGTRITLLRFQAKVMATANASEGKFVRFAVFGGK